MDTEACPVSTTTSMAAGRSSSYSSPTSSGAEPPTPLPPFSFSAACCSISWMTDSSYSTVLCSLMKETTEATSSSEMRQPWTRRGLPEPRGK